MLDEPLRSLVFATAAYPCALLTVVAGLSGALDPLVILLLALGWSTLLFKDAEEEHIQTADLAARCGVLFGCTYLAYHSPYGLASVLTAVAVLNTRHHESDSNVVAGVCLGGLATIAIAAKDGGIAGIVISFPAIAMAMVGLIWTQARLARRRVRRTLRGHQEEESPSGLRDRAFLGCTLATLLILLLPASVRATESAHNVLGSMVRWISGAHEEAAVSPFEEIGPDETSQDGATTEDGSDEGEASTEQPERPRRPVQSFPNALGFEGQTTLVDRPSSKRLELRVLHPEERSRFFSRVRPAYLRITSFDGFGQAGLLPADSEAVYTYNDTGDGFRDRWTQVATDPLRGIALELELTMTPILAPGRTGHLAIPRIEPVLGIRQPEVQHSESGMLSIPDDGMGLQVVRYRTRVPEVLARNLVNPRFDRSDSRYLQLPDSAAWQPILNELNRQLATLPTNGQPLRTVAAHFKRNYQYSLQTPAPGLEGLGQFLDEKSGYCTYFATSAMLMLRMQGIPARVVAGYRVTEFDEQADAYVAGDQVAHAWVEVKTSWHGWIPVEPTPSAGLDLAVQAESERIARAEAAARAKREAEAEAELENDGLNPAERQASSETEGAATTTTEQDDRGSPQDGSPPLRNRLFMMNSPWFYVVFLTIVIAQVVQRLLGVRKTRAVSNRDPLGLDDPSLLDDPRYLRVVEVFLGLGYSVGGRRTPMEFALTQIERRGTAFSPLLPITRMLYARRYGGRPMTGANWQRFELFEERINAMDLD